MIAIAVWVGILIGRGEKITFSWGDLCGLAFFWGLFSFTFYGFLLAVVIAIGAFAHFRREGIKEAAARLKELQANERRMDTIRALSEARGRLRVSRKVEAELNRAKKASNRLPKSSKKYLKKLEDRRA
jgi:predicted membrane metal-binding protein